MWKITLTICALFLAGCKAPKPKPLDKVKDENISISFKIDYKPQPVDTSPTAFTLFLDMQDDKFSHIQIGVDDEIHLYLNSTEYRLEETSCNDLYGPQYFCGYRLPFLSYTYTANLIQPVNLRLEIRRKKGQLITATANLPRFLTLASSLPADKKYDPLVDTVQINWLSSVPLTSIQYTVGQYEHSDCRGSTSSKPQPFDTYIQYSANEFGLNTNICNPMSYATIVATVESVSAMQTNFPIASANITFNQMVYLSLLSEALNP